MEKQDYLDGLLERTRLFYGEEAISKVRNSVVAIAGLGGVGAITAELLARWGVNKFRLLDKDKYDPSNLNRQLFATSKTLGEYKVDVTINRIKEINPYAEIELAIKDSVDNENVHSFVKGADIVIQTADSPSCQLFYRAAKKYKVPIANGYSTLIGCKVQVYDYRQDSFWFKIEELRDRYKQKRGKDITKMGREELKEYDRAIMHPAMPTMNFVTNIAGAMIVGEAIKLLTNTGKVCRFPNAISLDLYSNKMSVSNLYSPFSIETFNKVFGLNKGKERFQDLIIEKKKKAGVL
jgi:molybdopterin/thiamine biosynthesis adenylyltransferase